MLPLFAHFSEHGPVKNVENLKLILTFVSIHDMTKLKIRREKQRILEDFLGYSLPRLKVLCFLLCGK